MAQYVDDVDHLMVNSMAEFLHCARCLAACPPELSAAEFARLAVGRTPYGLQVWCIRHNANVYHLDLTSTPRPRFVSHALEPETPFADDLTLGCLRCGFDPGADA
jgi:hypothetical protein